MIDEILKRHNLKYEDLTPAERETFHSMLGAVEKSVMTIEKLRNYLSAMRFSVEQELTKTDNGGKQDMFLKARLKNYMLLEAFLSTPERAKKALEEALGNLKK